MDYNLQVNERPMVLEVTIEGEGRMTVAAGDAAHRVVYCAIGPHQLHLSIDGRTVAAYIFEADGHTRIAIDGQVYTVNERETSWGEGGATSEAPSLPKRVTPPMPAVVVRVLVAVDAVVAKGQPLVVVSAMKMETTLLAPYAGRVVGVNTREGAKVMPGDVLIDLAADPAHA
jgi:3-methylcrotonyl-CoA carboxylase alpha subunit